MSEDGLLFICHIPHIIFFPILRTAISPRLIAVEQAKGNETVTCSNKALIHSFIGSLNVVEGYYTITTRCAIISTYSRILVIFSLCRHS